MHLSSLLCLMLLLLSMSIKSAQKADATIARSLWLNGSLDEVPAKGVNDRCSLANSTDGDLLDRLVLHNSMNANNGSSKVFCGTYTKASTIKAAGIRSVRNLWAKKCDGWIAFSSINDSSVPFVSLPMQGSEEYGNMWQKVRSIWVYIGRYYLHDYDWFFLSGDDTFLIVENLRSYLASEELKLHLKSSKGGYIGRRMFLDSNQVFNSGGAGYLLDRRSLVDLMTSIESREHSCSPDMQTAQEDVKVSECLAAKGIFPIDTRDEHFRER